MKGYEYLRRVKVIDAPGDLHAEIEVVRVDANGFESKSYAHALYMNTRELDESQESIVALEAALDMLRAALLIRRDEARLKAARELAAPPVPEGGSR